MSNLNKQSKPSSVSRQQTKVMSAMSKKGSVSSPAAKKAGTAKNKVTTQVVRTKQAAAAQRSVKDGSLSPMSLRVMNGRGGTAQFSKNHGKIKSGDQIDSRLRKASPWYKSLRDPISGGGARIPDAIGIATATFQSVQVISVATNAQGMNGLLITSPYVCNSGAVNNVFPIGSAATAAAVTWGGAGVATTLAAQATLVSIAQSIRVVSAAIFAEYEGSSLNDTGEATCFVRPYENGTVAANIPQTYAGFQANYGSSSIPVNKARTKPLVAYWFPCSYNTWEYSDFQDTGNAEWSSQPTNGSVSYSPFWSFGHIMMGLTNTPSVKYTIAINYEFIPKLNTLDYIASDPSPVDEFEEQLVEQWVETDTQTGLSSNRVADAPPRAVKTEAVDQGMTASNMFGMLGSIVKEIAPLLLAL